MKIITVVIFVNKKKILKRPENEERDIIKKSNGTTIISKTIPIIRRMIAANHDHRNPFQNP